MTSALTFSAEKNGGSLAKRSEALPEISVTPSSCNLLISLAHNLLRVSGSASVPLFVSDYRVSMGLIVLPANAPRCLCSSNRVARHDVKDHVPALLGHFVLPCLSYQSGRASLLQRRPSKPPTLLRLLRCHQGFMWRRSGLQSSDFSCLCQLSSGGVGQSLAPKALDTQWLHSRSWANTCATSALCVCFLDP